MKKSEAYRAYVALATAVLHGPGRIAAPIEREEADLGPASVFKSRCSVLLFPILSFLLPGID